MNRQEAIDRLKNEVRRIEEIMKNGDYGCVDTDTWNEFAKKAEWRETLIELLTGPTPDPTAGLVPCGCGGKAFVYCPVGMTDVFVIRCEKCRVGITFAMDLPRAKKEWNTAMGWKGGAE